MRRTVTLAVILGLLAGVFAWADDFNPIPAEHITAMAPQLVAAAGKISDAPFKIDADADKATGLFKEQVGGLMVIPAKGIKIESLTGVDEANGAPVGYLFLHKLTLVVDGKPLEAAKLPTFTAKDGNGTDREIAALRLAVKRADVSDWKLLVFAKDKKPLVTASLKEQANGSDLPISVAGKESGNDQGALTVTMFGKYAAEVPLGKMP